MCFISFLYRNFLSILIMIFQCRYTNDFRNHRESNKILLMNSKQKSLFFKVIFKCFLLKFLHCNWLFSRLKICSFLVVSSSGVLKYFWRFWWLHQKCLRLDCKDPITLCKILQFLFFWTPINKFGSRLPFCNKFF